MSDPKKFPEQRIFSVGKAFRRHEHVAYMHAGVFTMLEEPEVPGMVRKYEKDSELRLKLIYESGVYAETDNKHSTFEFNELEALTRQGVLVELH